MKNKNTAARELRIIRHKIKYRNVNFDHFREQVRLETIAMNTAFRSKTWFEENLSNLTIALLGTMSLLLLILIG